MAKYRCPVCGATHREMPQQCRLCGQKMGEGAVVGERQSTRQMQMGSKGVGGIMLIAILAVVVVAVGLAIAGIGPGGRQVEQLVNKTRITLQRTDGWSELADAEGHFVTDMPSNGRKQSKEVTTPLVSETGTSWTVDVGRDTRLAVTYVEVDPATFDQLTPGSTIPADGGRKRIRDLTAKLVADIEAKGGTVARNSDEFFQGVAAQYLETRNESIPELSGEKLYGKYLVFMVQNRIYMVSVRTVYPWDKMTQYPLLIQNFAIT